MKMALRVRNQSIETSGITKDYKEAICEYIWNGFEANATEVRISYTLNDMGAINTITVSDNGDGIAYETLSDTFGTFLASPKNLLSQKIKTRANKGKGRFSFSAFSTDVQWHTKYLDNGIFKTYAITLSANNKDIVEYDVPEVIKEIDTTGTVATFNNVANLRPENIDGGMFEEYLLSEFAWYLFLNKHKPIKLFVNDQEIDYEKHIDISLSETITKTIDNNEFKISLIIWNKKNK